MGIQPIDDVTLIRHAYTLTCYQRQALAAQLLNYLIGLVKTKRVLVVHGNSNLGNSILPKTCF